jgi:hypothetical protein
MKRLGFLALFALLACPLHASPPADSAFGKITRVANTASATFTCTGPASCVLSDIKDQASGTVVLAARVLAPGAFAVASMTCPVAGGPLTWSGTVIGRTTGMTDSPSAPISTTGSCPLAQSPGATMNVTLITVGS